MLYYGILFPENAHRRTSRAHPVQYRTRMRCNNIVRLCDHVSVYLRRDRIIV